MTSPKSSKSELLSLLHVLLSYCNHTRSSTNESHSGTEYSHENSLKEKQQCENISQSRFE